MLTTHRYGRSVKAVLQASIILNGSSLEGSTVVSPYSTQVSRVTAGHYKIAFPTLSPTDMNNWVCLASLIGNIRDSCSVSCSTSPSDKALDIYIKHPTKPLYDASVNVVCINSDDWSLLKLNND